jgi:mannitol 2-dehydrogenase
MQAIPDQMKGFGELHRAAVKDGALDAATKELMAVAIGICTRCDDCISLHMHDALRAGATPEMVHEAMAHPLIAGFLDKVEREEIIPLVPPVPDTDLNAYFALIHSRFANPEVADTIRRLCLDGSNRQPKFILPSLRDNLAAGRVPRGLILESALWCRYCAGVSDSGTTIAPNDPVWERLTEVARAARAEPALWLAMDDIYGEVGRDPVVIAEFTRALNALWENGTVAVLTEYLSA